MGTYEEIVAIEQDALGRHTQQRYEEAAQTHLYALERARELGRPRLMAALFNRLGQAFEAAGNVQFAVIAYEYGLNALAAEAKLDINEALSALSGMTKGFGGPQNLVVLDLYTEPGPAELEAAEADTALPVRLLINTGNAYLRQPQAEPAAIVYQQALRRPEIAAAPVSRAHALAHLGIIAQWQGQLDEAEAQLREALRLLATHADPSEARRALSALAAVYRERGQADLALATYQQALAFYAQSADRRGEGRVRASLGHLYLAQQRTSAARLEYDAALSLATAVQDQDTLWHAHWGLGCCQRASGELAAAADSFRRSLKLILARQRGLRTDEGKVTFLDSVQDVFDQLVAVHLEQAHSEPAAYGEALAVAEEARGRALQDLMGGWQRRRPTQATGVRGTRLRPFRDRYEDKAEMAPEIPFPGPNIRQMAASIDVPIYAQMARGVNLPGEPEQEMGEADKATTAPSAPPLPPLARLVLHVLPESTAIWAVRPDGELKGYVANLGRDALGEQVAALREALDVGVERRGLEVTRDAHRRAGGAPVDARPLLRALYDELIAPVADALPRDGTPVVIEPHGALWLVPFAALLAPDDAPLFEHWPLLYAPSTAALDEIRREPDYGKPAELKALIVGNPVMPTVPPHDGLEITLGPLRGAEEEARAIARQFRRGRKTLLLGHKADRTTVIVRAAQCGILHLASHGVAYADDPLASFIALAPTAEGGGLLTARDVIGMSLPADLVALSACQTGLGRIAGEGMIGLSRAFLVAGARAVLVSQWSVSDAATAALMTAFYRHYLALDDKAIALQQAMRELRARPEYAHPRYWAPFVVIGAEA